MCRCIFLFPILYFLCINVYVYIYIVNVDVIYLDSSKAFDKVDFDIAFSKAQRLGILGNKINSLRALLTDRTQSVVVNGVSSDPCPVLSRVPQGSVLAL